MENLKGLTPIGTTMNPKVNGGAPVPLFKMDGDLNTEAGWNRRVLQDVIPRFTRVHGRPPVDDEEALAWNEQRGAEDLAEYHIAEYEKLTGRTVSANVRKAMIFVDKLLLRGLSYEQVGQLVEQWKRERQEEASEYAEVV